MSQHLHSKRVAGCYRCDLSDDEMLVTGTVTTTHPTDYVLHNERDGTKWRLTEEGHWERIWLRVTDDV